ncbi:hypothetical protein [Pseudoalteromonas sp. T1lg23B]|uniref:hypothetical protein n=1 Tax=Pseudoalteromonas sp. T1lg23B TaxID=2077097 RepID=UPI000CF6395E|nr:hypothetical protein [Pseudoalteromonas sp. T1lg23B]
MSKKQLIEWLLRQEVLYISVSLFIGLGNCLQYGAKAGIATTLGCIGVFQVVIIMINAKIIIEFF